MTQRRSFALVLVLLIAPALCGGETTTITFQKKDLGKTPSDWKSDKTGKGEGSIWKVVADDTAPSKSGFALAQVAEGADAVFNLCVLEKERRGDVEIEVAFKAVEGEVDQGGGVVWRYQDANNYYIARMNPLENNYRVYVVSEGKRSQLASRIGLKIPLGAWHTLKVRHKGESIECFLDGKKLLDATDTTIKEAGRIGLWTKADARTYFDNLKFQALK